MAIRRIQALSVPGWQTKMEMLNYLLTGGGRGLSPKQQRGNVHNAFASEKKQTW